MVVKDTIEEKIIKLQESKSDLADSIISGDNVGMSSLGKAELMELLGV
jgi:SNF2 family DNA or RNA helicase